MNSGEPVNDESKFDGLRKGVYGWTWRLGEYPEEGRVLNVWFVIYQIAGGFFFDICQSIDNLNSYQT